MKRWIVLCLSTFLVITYSCKKQDTLAIIPPQGDYFPLTNNSFWQYLPISFIAQPSSITKKVDGRNYSLFEYQGGAKSNYSGSGSIETHRGSLWDSYLVRKESGKYYQLISTDQFIFPLDVKKYYEFTFMEDNAPVGTVWNMSTAEGTYTFSNGSTKMEQSYIGRIEAYLPEMELPNPSATTGKKKFIDVVKVNMKILAVGFDATGKEVIRVEEFYNKWYARNIGLIKISYTTSNKTFEINVNDYKVY
jgi:hypothetical protein